MNLKNFKLEYESTDGQGYKFKIWSGPSVKGDWYNNKGVDPGRDRVFYIQIAESQYYRFKYIDQTKLLELVINNKQLSQAKTEYILMMLEKLISWLPVNYEWPIKHKEKIMNILGKLY